MKHLERFLEYLEFQKNYSKYTILNYHNDIKEFLDFLTSENLNYLSIEYSDITNYMLVLDKNKLSKNSISRKISSLKSFYKYLYKNNVIKKDPLHLVSLPKKDKHLPKFLYYNELEELFCIFDLNKPLEQRDRLIVELLYATGIRVSELVAIKVKDINFYDMSIKVLGKGNKERIVDFGEYALDSLNLYLTSGRKALNKNNSDYLLLNNLGGVLTDRGVRLIIDRSLKRTSIKTKISPHTLRHTFATHMLNEGCDILTVQELLGHESLRATQIYTHVTNEKLKEVYYHSLPRNIDNIKK